jgi:hypothetical protein
MKDKQLWTKRHTVNQQTNNCGQTSHRKPTKKQLWTHVTETNRQTSCLSVGFLCDVCPQLFVCWFSVWRFVHSCLSFFPSFSGVRVDLIVGFLHRQPTDKQLWTNATPKTNRQTTVDKRHTENQQTNNCGQTVWCLSTVVCLLVVGVAFVHSCLSLDLLYDLCPQLFVFYPSFNGVRAGLKQLWTNATQKTNRQTTVDKRHTENQQTNNCGQTSHRKPTIKWLSVWRLSTVVCLLIYCMTFVHSCLSFIPLSVGFVPA